MDSSLNQELGLWLGRLADDWAIQMSALPAYLGREEIDNRVNSYPAFSQALLRTPIDMTEVGRTGKVCWALGVQTDAIRFGEFASNDNSAEAITNLLANFPPDDNDAADRIDEFTGKCLELGYMVRETNNLNASSAGLLASVILTAVFPKRFVDFRQNRWSNLAEELNYSLFTTEKPTYGEMIVAAGRFAQAICATQKFQELWPVAEPLWTIAGICRRVNSQSISGRPKDAPIYLSAKDLNEESEEEFDEGALALRAHRIRERSSAVVRKAKELWRASDPLLRCDVCGFSFIEAYGEDYIEAHHTKPMRLLEAGSRTGPSDLAKLCANCHRMVHVGNQCLELEDLRLKIKAT